MAKKTTKTKNELVLIETTEAATKLGVTVPKFKKLATGAGIAPHSRKEGVRGRPYVWDASKVAELKS